MTRACDDAALCAVVQNRLDSEALQRLQAVGQQLRRRRHVIWRARVASRHNG